MTLYEITKIELTKMLARQLEYSPKAEDLPKVTAIMAGDLMAMGLCDTDEARIRQSFQSIAINYGRWPTAKMVRENMMPTRTSNSPMLPRPPLTAQQRRHLESIGLTRTTDENDKQYALRCIRHIKESALKIPKNIKKAADELEAEQEREAIQNEEQDDNEVTL